MVAESPRAGIPLHVQTLVALVAGAVFGLVAPTWAPQIKIVGDVFVLALKALIMPLLLASMVTGVAGVGDPRHLGRFGWQAFVLFNLSMAIAVASGVLLVSTVRPGDFPPPPALAARVQALGRTATGDDLRTGLDGALTAEVPKLTPETRKVLVDRYIADTATGGDTSVAQKRLLGQITAATLRQQTATTASAPGAKAPASIADTDTSVSAFARSQVTKLLVNPFRALAEDNIPAVVLFALLLGLFLARMGTAGKPLLDAFEGLNGAMMGLIGLVMKLTPFGVFALISGTVAATGPQVFLLLGKYALTVFAALGIHGFVVLPLMVRVLGGGSGLGFLKAMREAFVVAFSTASSNAALPVSLRCCEDNLGIAKPVSRFVLPLGATLNMAGTALYEAIAAVFIAQVFMIDLSVGQIVIVFFTAVLAAVGAAGIPMAGLVTMTMVLSAVGLPIEGIALILSVDRVLDMCRTVVNVEGDAVAAVIIDRWNRKA